MEATLNPEPPAVADMRRPTSVTQWLERLKEGDREAAQKIWNRYYSRLVGIANWKLQKFPRRFSDREDIAAEAFAGFFRSVEEGRFPALDDRDNLWQVLLSLVDRRAIDAWRRYSAARRGGGDVRGDSALEDEIASERIQAADPTPESVDALLFEMESIWNLEDQYLKLVVMDKLQGYSNREIADRQHCSVRSVERYLSSLRTALAEVLD